VTVAWLLLDVLVFFHASVYSYRNCKFVTLVPIFYEEMTVREHSIIYLLFIDNC
jgi:hypothetical protein